MNKVTLMFIGLTVKHNLNFFKLASLLQIDMNVSLYDIMKSRKIFLIISHIHNPVTFINITL